MTVPTSRSDGTLMAPWVLDMPTDAGATPPSLEELLHECAAELHDRIETHGAVLLRGARPAAQIPGTLRRVAHTLFGLEPRSYTEQSSPRTHVGDGLFTATEYPSHTELFLHNELSYATSWPAFLIFYCAKPADEGGSTTLADCREVLRTMPDDIRSAFHARSWSYVRNLRGTAGLSWQSVFQTASRAEVEAYCAANDISLTWVDNGARLRAVRPATLMPPRGGPPVWFNHIAGFHVSTLPAATLRSLRRMYPPDQLPVNTYFGDGEVIPDDVVAQIRAAYRRVQTRINWQAGDLAIVNNHLVAHGRLPFRGTREIFVMLVGEGSRR
jgi:alpha-ketoglutarate-dependent taurine dioxygenase